LNFCSIFSQAVEIPNDKNCMNKVITQPLIGWMISSKPLTHHEILLKNKIDEVAEKSPQQQLKVTRQ
jgi:hypothetical protein